MIRKLIRILKGSFGEFQKKLNFIESGQGDNSVENHFLTLDRL